MTRRVSAIARLMFCGAVSLYSAAAAVTYVSAGQALQPVLDDAMPGDTIILQAGATFRGNFVLRSKVGFGWITIQSSLVDALPPAGKRVTPMHAPKMAKLMSPNGGPALATGARAHHYRLIGLEFAAPPGVYTFNLIQLGSGTETSASELPHSFELDRLYIHGDPVAGGKRGITLNSSVTSITNSWISGFTSREQDTQAIFGWNGIGFYKIENNYLEASGENIMFGGAVPSIPNLIPSDILIRRNHLFKPLSWKIGDPSYKGTPWVVKNLLELKAARRVNIDGNILENNWMHGQVGFAVQLTVRTSSGRMPWAAVEDVVFQNNIVRNSHQGINILGKDGTYGGVLRRIVIKNNIFEDIDANFLQVLSDSDYVTVDHNTVFHKGNLVLFAGTNPVVGFVYKNNLSAKGSYGIFGSGKQEGNVSLTHYAPGSVVVRNVIAGASSAVYPLGNFFPGSIYDVLFQDAFSSDFALTSTSPYIAKGTDGKNIGADCTVVRTATSGIVVAPNSF